MLAFELNLAAGEDTGDLSFVGLRAVDLADVVAYRSAVLMRVGLAVLGILGLAGAGSEAFVLLAGGHTLRLFSGADGDVFVGLQL
ncbi:hypothetical protein D3C85_1586540 [compost metagenome]